MEAARKQESSFRNLLEVTQPYGMDQFFTRLLLGAKSEHHLRTLLMNPNIVPPNCRLLSRHERLVEEAYRELMRHGHNHDILETELLDAVLQARVGRDLTPYYRDMLREARSSEIEDGGLWQPLHTKSWAMRVNVFTMTLLDHRFSLQCYWLACDNALVVHFETSTSALTERLTARLLTLPASLQWRENGVEKEGVHFCYRFILDVRTAASIMQGKGQQVHRRFRHDIAQLLRSDHIPVKNVNVGDQP